MSSEGQLEFLFRRFGHLTTALDERARTVFIEAPPKKFFLISSEEVFRIETGFEECVSRDASLRWITSTTTSA